ncbi:putative flippase GtrA [Saccharothrix saharensis]|uniref:Putative flippase GtrA n=1 Tax=Saccharothrix saharensis TaxID=571190 RepID=A0A543J9Y5_9PSEU|nr:GtrA family protein [Saccharothrix saharensis]TQM79626.1 putative flippase GtrA [Saccharothrix saharensis]
MARNGGVTRQAVVFVLVGAVCALIDYGSYSALLASGVWVHAAKAASFALGTTAAFFLNRRFTFGVSAGGVRQVSGFALLYLSTFLVNVLVNALALHLLPPIRVEYVVAWLAAQGVATTVNFAGLRVVVFHDGKPGGVGQRVVG